MIKIYVNENGNVFKNALINFSQIQFPTFLNIKKYFHQWPGLRNDCCTYNISLHFWPPLINILYNNAKFYAYFCIFFILLALYFIV